MISSMMSYGGVPPSSGFFVPLHGVLRILCIVGLASFDVVSTLRLGYSSAAFLSSNHRLSRTRMVKKYKVGIKPIF